MDLFISIKYALLLVILLLTYIILPLILYYKELKN